LSKIDNKIHSKLAAVDLQILQADHTAYLLTEHSGTRDHWP